MKRLLTAIAAVSLLSLAAHARAAEKMVIGVGLMQSTADLAANDGAGINAAYDHSELGGRFEYWNMMRENYALNFSANLGWFSETDKPGTGFSGPDIKYTQSSWSLRLGGDRVWSPMANTRFFIGPGIEYWSGKAKFENIPGITNGYETENVSRYSLHAHMGAIMMMGPTWGLSAQVGERIGIASYEEAGAKSTWYPSSPDGAI